MWVLLFFIFALASAGLTLTAQALDVTAASGSSEDIQSAVDTVAAAGEGTVIIPEGDFAFDAQVVVPGGVSIIGAGTNNTILRNTASLRMDLGGGGPVRISGISFFSTNTAITFLNAVDFRVDHCSFESTKSAVYVISIRDRYGSAKSRGVFDHCSWYDPFGNMYGVSIGPSPWPAGESRITHLGTAENIFIEDCHFRRVYHPIGAFNGARYVLRHCVTEDSRNSIDGHGPVFVTWPLQDPLQERGTRCYEIYENNCFMNPEFTGGWAPIKPRGGGGVIFNNHIENYDYAIIFTMELASYNGTEPPGTYPCPDQIHDFWIWDNTTVNIRNGLILRYSNDAETLIQEDRDYFLRAPNLVADGFEYTPYPYPHPLVGENADAKRGTVIAGR